jgi:hypothetical protein
MILRRTGREMMNAKEETTCVLACETLRPELELMMKAAGSELPVSYVESGKHVFPDQLRESIQEGIDGIAPCCDTVLLLFGFCGNAMVGVRTGARRVVLPKVADCIPIFLGSREKRNEYGTRRYFFTEGYLNAEANPAADYARMVERYGEDNAHMVIHEMLKHYESLSVVDTGAFDVAAVEAALTELSSLSGVPVDVLPGNLRLIGMLLSGDWPEDEFFVFGPGTEITLDDSMSFQSVSQVG